MNTNNPDNIPDGMPKWNKDGYKSWREWAIDCFNAGKKEVNVELLEALQDVLTTKSIIMKERSPVELLEIAATFKKVERVINKATNTNK